MSWSSSGASSDVDTSMSQPSSDAESGSGGDLINFQFWFPTAASGNTSTTLGQGVEGSFQAADGTSLAGTAKVKFDGSVQNEKSVVGPFSMGSSPPPVVEQGEDGAEGASFDFEFVPDIAGISYVNNGLKVRADIGAIQYGSVEGKVTDYDGNPVSGAAVFGEGEGTTTDSNGDYIIAAPGGTDVDITSLQKSETVTRTTSSGSTVTVNFQFGRVIIEVVDPELNPMTGTPVKIGNDNYETNDEGRVTLERAGLDPYNVVIDGEEEYTVEVKQQGGLVEKTYGDSFSGFRATVTEESTDLPVQSTTVSFKDGGISSQTNSNGRASSLINKGGELTIVLGKGDRRYETEEVEANVVNGEIKTGEFALSRRSNTPTIS